MCPFSWLSCVSGQFFLVVIIQSRLPPPLPQPPPVLSHHSRYILLTAWAGPRLDAQRGPGIHSCPQRLGARFSLESDVGSQEGRAASSSSCCVPHFPEGCVCLPTQCWGAAGVPPRLLTLHPGCFKVGRSFCPPAGFRDFCFCPTLKHAPWTCLAPLPVT